MPIVSIYVHVDHRGGWEVELADEADPVRCATLDDAERVARRLAPHTRRDLLVHDAYERVLRRDLLEPEPRR